MDVELASLHDAVDRAGFDAKVAAPPRRDGDVLRVDDEGKVVENNPTFVLSEANSSLAALSCLSVHIVDEVGIGGMMQRKTVDCLKEAIGESTSFLSFGRDMAR
jgi:hypothetical protein